MNNMRSTLAAVWRIAAPYFRSEDKFAGRLLLAAVIAIELTVVGINVLLNQWNNRFYTALQDKSWDAFVREMGIFCILAFAYIGLAVYQLYLNQWLQIRWRKWLTERYLGRWLHGANHYRMQLQGDAADNPDQRIAEDVRMFVDQTLNLGVGFLNAVIDVPSGPSCPTTWLMVPPLPAVSMPCSTSSTRRLPPTVDSANSFSWSSAIAGPVTSVRAASALAFLPGAPDVASLG